MPGLDLSQVSRNWKKLQEQLKSRKEPDNQKTGTKRKRPDERHGPINGHKHKKTHHTQRPNNRNMGFGSSKPSDSTTQDTTHSKLIQSHDIPPEDILAAYGSNTNGIPRTYTDKINGGVHPTLKPGKYIALDCEMVGTGPPPHEDHVLARASLVNFHGEQVYDSYVLPPPGIVVKDYRTFVSGIKPEHLTPGYARPFAEVQRDISTFLHGRILIGHALKNDIQVLQLHTHPKRDIRDTSRHPPFRVQSGGRPPALRVLAKRELGLEIQTGEHSSIEDARAAMAIFRKEKRAFEEDNRNRFGPRARSDVQPVAKKQIDRVVNGQRGQDSDDSEDEDWELLDGEEDDISDNMDLSKPKPTTPIAKKRKKKKRTKRK